jgi:hypothetical protein
MTGQAELHWSHRCRSGNFRSIPAPLTWADSGWIAHLIDGYELTGSQSAGLKIAHRVMAEVRGTGRSTASALDLWVTLFFEHRYYYHTGSEPDVPTERLLDVLSERLRQKLLRLSGPQLTGLLSVMQEPHGR